MTTSNPLYWWYGLPARSSIFDHHTTYKYHSLLRQFGIVYLMFPLPCPNMPFKLSNIPCGIALLSWISKGNFKTMSKSYICFSSRDILILDADNSCPRYFL